MTKVDACCWLETSLKLWIRALALLRLLELPYSIGGWVLRARVSREPRGCLL